jgi:hypothetical protein
VHLGLVINHHESDWGVTYRSKHSNIFQQVKNVCLRQKSFQFQLTFLNFSFKNLLYNYKRFEIKKKK